jgi:diguanylate cyclase (GGDEF)-like protein
METKILVVDDEAHIRETLRKIIQRMGLQCETATDGIDALSKLQDGAYDIVISDIRMPRMDGMQLLKEISANYKGVDVLIMTAYHEDYSYTDVIESGATDFIAKPFKRDELQAKIKRILYERNLRAELMYLSIRDSLTGLYNRRYFYQKLQEEVERAKRQRHPLSLIILDIDHFKQYNDTHGHLEGDQVLASLGQILLTSIRQNVDTAYRYGGDEFAVLLIEADLGQASQVAERVRTSFEAKGIDGCTLSLGVTQMKSQDESEDLIRRADQGMYQAKRAGGNRVQERP